MNWLRSRGAKKNETEENLYSRWEQDYDLTPVPAMGLFDEYLEMGAGLKMTCNSKVHYDY